MELDKFETELIDKLFLELSQFTRARTEDEIEYDTLLFAVQRKFPDETRFQTALRYIRNAENNSQDNATKAAEPGLRL
jgi:hypothetical protein